MCCSPIDQLSETGLDKDRGYCEVAKTGHWMLGAAQRQCEDTGRDSSNAGSTDDEMDANSPNNAATGQGSDPQRPQPRMVGGGEAEKGVVRGVGRAGSSNSSSSSSLAKEGEVRKGGGGGGGLLKHKKSRGGFLLHHHRNKDEEEPEQGTPTGSPGSSSFFHIHHHHSSGAGAGADSHSQPSRHHQSLANILPGSRAVRSANMDSTRNTSSSSSPPVPHPRIEHNTNYGPHETTMMNRSASTPFPSNPPAHLHFPHHIPADVAAPAAASINSANTAASSMKSSGKKIFSFTKKATRLAGDLAFGRFEDTMDYPTYAIPNSPSHSSQSSLVQPPSRSNSHSNSHPDSPSQSLHSQSHSQLQTQTQPHSQPHSQSQSPSHQSHLPQFHPQVQRQKYQKQQLTIEYHTKMKNILSLTMNHSMSFYIDFLRFFLKYMDDSELDDPFLYSVTRNSFWNTWYIKYLRSINETLDTRASLLAEKDQNQQKQQGNQGNEEISVSDSLWSDSHDRVSASDPKLNSESNLASTSTFDSQTSSNSPDDIKSKIAEIPSIDEIDAEIFQDRKMVLLLLWHNQIINRLSNHASVIHKLLSSHAKNSEICIITSNRLKPYQSTPGNASSKLSKNHISPAHLELIDGWQLRHDFPNYKVSLVNISDRFQVLLDLKNSAYLPDDLQQQYPHFNDISFLTEDFINSNIKPKEKAFLSDYSSFTAPSIHKLPVRDESQILVYAPDFTRLIFNENDVNMGLTEFERVLKPGGSIFLILYDVLSFKNTYTVNTEHEVRLGEYIQIFINNEISKLSKLPNLSQIIIKILKGKNFKKIKYVKLGIPVISFNEQQHDYDEISEKISQEHMHQAPKKASAEPDILIPRPKAGDEKDADVGTDYDYSEESNITLIQPVSKNRNATYVNVNSQNQKTDSAASGNTRHAATSPFENSKSNQQRQQRENRHQHIHEAKSTSRNGSPYAPNPTNTFDNDYENDVHYEHRHEKENLGDISDQPIASLYCMLSSYIDFLRLSQIVDLHSWMSDPINGHVRNSGSFSGVAGLTETTVHTLRLWLDWKLHGFEGEMVRKIVCERIKEGNIDREGHDVELGVKVKIHDIGNLEKRENPLIYFDDISQDVFNDGILAGLDSIMLVTAEKGKT